MVWHFYLLAAILGIFAAVWPWHCAFCLILAVIFQPKIWQFPRLFTAILIFLGLFAWIGREVAQFSHIIAKPPAWILTGGERICARIHSVQGLPDKRLRIILQNIRSKDNYLSGQAAWTWDKPTFIPAAGQEVCIRRPLRATGGFANASMDSWALRDMASGVYWRLWSSDNSGNPEVSGSPDPAAAMRLALQQKFLAALGGPEAVSQPKAMLLALLFGNRYFLQSSTVQKFAKASLAHSLALSGQHLAIVCLLAFELVTLTGWIFPGIYLYKPRHILVFALAVPLAIAYLWLGNAPPSLMRAAAMLALLAVWQWRQTSFTPIDLLCAAAGCLLLFNPLLAFDTGFQLSVLCVGVIALLWPGLLKLTAPLSAKQSLFYRILAKILLIVLVSFAIQTALLPLTLMLFHMAGFWFLLNVLWLPALGCIVLPGACLGLLLGSIPLFSGVAHSILDMAALPAHGILWLIGQLESAKFLSEPSFLIPSWIFLPAFALIVGGMASLWGDHMKKGRMCLILSLCLMLGGPLARLKKDSALIIEAIDVGQAQSILVTAPGCKLLIDGGGSTPRFDAGQAVVGPYLSANSRPALTALINSHPDLDHLGGLFHILDSFTIDAAFSNGREANRGLRERWQNYRALHGVKSLTAGDILQLGDGLLIEVLHPPAAETQWQGNSASLILRLVRDGRGIALFPGDAGKDALRHLLEANANLQADILFAPHHGSDKNFSRQFYQKVRPRLVIASCGRFNRWHYPGKKLASYLKERGIPLQNTGEMGKVRVEAQENGNLEITTAR